VTHAAGEPVLGSGSSAEETVTQVPLVPPPPPTTGERGVDDAIERLSALDTLPVVEHVGVFDETHRMLQDALADLDED
jgi:hypothetical protein